MASQLSCISPVDGRYRSKTNALRVHFSEFGLILNRIRVECRWLIHLAQCEHVSELTLSDAAISKIEAICTNFDEAEAEKVKETERTTRHDVKAVEYYLKDKFAEDEELKPASEFIHFAATSEDINNLSWALSLKESRDNVLVPTMSALVDKIALLASETADVPMMARTHGQPASPTTVGKEIANTAYRLQLQLNDVQSVAIRGKKNGAVGNYNAHLSAYPDADWSLIGKEFVESLGLVHNPFTTQIEPHDFIAQLFDSIKRFNTVLIDFDRDMWTYISLGYFLQRKLPGEVGSSTMPHKVNPIDFENSEGNIGLANALLQFLGNKLPVSRMQRDLTDSTVLRNMGVGLAHSLIAYASTVNGLNKVSVDVDAVRADLDQHWELLAEPIQTVMRRYAIPNPYEKLKEFTQGKKIGQQDMVKFVMEGIPELPEDERKRLAELTPATYTGNAAAMAHKLLDEIAALRA